MDKKERQALRELKKQRADYLKWKEEFQKPVRIEVPIKFKK